MRPERDEPGRFSEEREVADDQAAGAEGGGPEEPRAPDPRAVDARDEAKKRASRYVMEDPEEAARRREAAGGREGAEEGFGNESRPHDEAPISEERDAPDPEGERPEEEEPGVDQEDEAWRRIDRDGG